MECSSWYLPDYTKGDRLINELAQNRLWFGHYGCGNKKTGMSKEELISPETTDPATIENLGDAAGAILDAVRSRIPISIMADYDTDGITSAAILLRLLKNLGAEPQVRLPKRLSEGYGLSIDAINDFDPGLLITVDNGIAAAAEVTYAKLSGFSVVILDHHLPKGALPDADVIVDPHVHPERNGFEHYCGAGLSLKLAEMMVAKGTSSLSGIMEQLTILATVGTIGDVMPLVGDNRRIVKEGLSLINRISALKSPLSCMLSAEWLIRTVFQAVFLYPISIFHTTDRFII